MNSMERVMAAISHQEPDRIPIFHLFSHYGAKELNLSIKKYFKKPENVVKAQVLMREKYSNDCFYTFYYAPIEIEAFGGEVVYIKEGPPNSGEPLIREINEIKELDIPKIENSKGLQKVLETTRSLKRIGGDEIPIIGVVMSPFSLPVMQMGFEKYLELMYFRKEEFNLLMQINQEFCINWANAQLKSGATAICYFDPLASPTIIEREKYLQTGYKIAKNTISKINGAVATHLASGRALSVVDDIASTGSAVIGFSSEDNITKIKEKAKDKICLLGNLNGLEMASWSKQKAQSEVKKLIDFGAKDGGLIISDNHGEIPWQVPEDILLEITQTVIEYGKYPIKVNK